MDKALSQKYKELIFGKRGGLKEPLIQVVW